MKRLTRFLLIVVSVLTVSSVAATGWFAFHRSHRQQARLVFGPPCREGLVSAEPQTDAPLRLTIADAGCDNSQTASVQFVAENVSSSPIIQFEIRAIETYDELVDQGGGVTTIGIVLNPHHTQTGFIGGGVITGACGKPVGPLKTYQVTVWSVTFGDGRTWTRTELPHNKSLNRSGGNVSRIKRDAAIRAARLTQPLGFLPWDEMKRVPIVVALILLATSVTTMPPVNCQRVISNTGTLNGKVFRSDTNVPISNSYILLMQETEKPVDAQHFDTRTDDKGKYKFNDILAGKYTVLIYSWYRNRSDVPCAESTAAKTVDDGHVTVEWQWKSNAFMEIVTLRGFAIDADHERSKDFDVACR